MSVLDDRRKEAIDPMLDSKVPDTPIEAMWDQHKFDMKLVAPHNRRRFKVIVVGTGLAGGAAAATLGELGYDVHAFTFHDSPRRAHSIAAQGGINAAKNYKGDGDSIYRLFYDTVKGGDYRAREANVYRLAQISVDIIDQCVAQGVPFAREYGGLLDNRSFGGAQVSRTFYARGQTGQQLLLGCYQALARQIGLGTVDDLPALGDARPRREGRPRLRHRRAQPPHRRDHEPQRARRHPRHGRLRQRLLPVDQRQGLQRHRHLARPPAGRVVRQPMLHADPSDMHPGERRLPVEAHTHVRVTSQRRARVGPEGHGRPSPTRPDPRRRSATTSSNAGTRRTATSCRATWHHARSRRSSTRAEASDRSRTACTSTSRAPSTGSGATLIEERYGNLFEMYERITDEDPYRVPMRIYPAIHYTMGGLWVDYELQSTIPGCFVAGEANFSDHGANRLGASALMQGLSDGYFVLPVHGAELSRRSARPASRYRPTILSSTKPRALSETARASCCP